MNTEQELRHEIIHQLSKVSNKNAPKMHKKLLSKEGYTEIEAKIILMVANEGLTPSACIPHIESEL